MIWEIVYACVPVLLGIFLSHWLRSKPRVFAYGPPPAHFEADPASGRTGPTRAESIIVQNTGRSKADGLEIILSEKPFALSIQPPRLFEELNLDGGRYSLKLGSLVPREIINLSVLYNPATQSPRVESIKTIDGFVANGLVDIFPRLPRYMLVLSAGFSLIGIVYVWFLLLPIFRYVLQSLSSVSQVFGSSFG